MTRYLLDTNIISNVVKRQPAAHLCDWLARKRDDDLFVSSMTAAEIQCGILALPGGRRQRALEARFAGNEGHKHCLQVESCRLTTMPVWARLMAEGKAVGRPRSALDMIIAAISETHGSHWLWITKEISGESESSTRCGNQYRMKFRNDPNSL